MSDVADVTAICAKHCDRRKHCNSGPQKPEFRLGDDLPADRHSLIKKDFDIPPATQIVCFIGGKTNFGFGPYVGLAITDRGLAWVNGSPRLIKKLWYQHQGSLDWEALANCRPCFLGSLWDGPDRGDIVFDQKNRFFYDFGEWKEIKHVYDLVLELQDWARQKLLAEQPPESTYWPFNWV